MRVLIVQTSSLNDLVQSTGLLENLYRQFSGITIDLIVRPENQGLFDDHPYIHSIIPWDRSHTYQHIKKIAKQLGQYTYDYVFNLETGLASGLLTYLVKGKIKIGFRSNLFAFTYKYKIKQQENTRENGYNQLLTPVFQPEEIKPVLYPHSRNFQLVKRYKKNAYICIAPIPQNHNRNEPVEAWAHFIKDLSANKHVYLLGDKKDWDECEILLCGTNPKKVHNFAGKLSLLEIAVLLQDASMNYLNHAGFKSIAEAVEAPLEVWHFQKAS